MRDLFIAILSLSIQASYVALWIFFVRMLLKKFPKIFSYALWSILLFRLLLPVGINSPVSILPETLVAERAQESITMETTETFIEVPVLFLGDKASLVKDLLLVDILAAVYFSVLGILLLHFAGSLWKIRRKIQGTKRISGEIFMGNEIKRPFAYGVIHPRIYLPKDLSAMERTHIIEHEKEHLRRQDPLIKALSYLILLVHWFNPILWISFVLMVRDMEQSCDEAVLKSMEKPQRKAYIETLLHLEMRKPDPVLLAGYSAGNLKGRVRNILQYRSPKKWVRVFSLMLLGISAVLLLTNPMMKPSAEIIDELLETEEQQPVQVDNLVQPKEVERIFGDHLRVYEYENQMFVVRDHLERESGYDKNHVLTFHEVQWEMKDEKTGMVLHEARNYVAGDQMIVEDRLDQVYYDPKSDNTYLVFNTGDGTEESFSYPGYRVKDFVEGNLYRFILDVVPVYPEMDRFIRLEFREPEALN
ncbi:M56 family metallopeptidase [Proteiniclasticum ruminis]|uniref:M56 family metallopeptidase n=1 Tax=Proteiniclasticum ruminis TaxID=398199 RepID=UPI00289B167C|nr:M56 family metallopeptidase [Proteiniclasticum ruminis]